VAFELVVEMKLLILWGGSAVEEIFVGGIAMVIWREDLRG
jgi:hypothetical protein